MEAYEQKIVIRNGDLIMPNTSAPPSRTLRWCKRNMWRALWQLSLQRPAPAAPSWQLNFSDSVAVTPLAAYEQTATLEVTR